MQNAGIRVVDVRDPAHPREIAYFNPGDVDAGPDTVLDYAWGHPHYDAKRGQIWFATESGGFWVVELEPQVRRYLAMKPPVPARQPDGAPGTSVAVATDLRGEPRVSPMWCTLGPVAAAT